MNIFAWRQLLRRDQIALELTPLAFYDKSVEATKQLFTLLHGLGTTVAGNGHSFKMPSVLSLELIATRDKGIRFLVRVPSNLVDSVEQTILAYLPEVKVTKENIRNSEYHKGEIVSFRQQKHYAYPLQDHSQPESYDPIAYLMGAMTKLSPEEQITFQIIVNPIRPKAAAKLSYKLLRNENVASELNDSSRIGGVIVKGLNRLSFALTDTATGLYHGGSKQGVQTSQKTAQNKHQIQQGLKPARILTSFEQELALSMHAKLSQPLFRTDIRAHIRAKSTTEAKRRTQALNSALAAFSVSDYQSLGMMRSRLSKYQAFVFHNRLPSLTKRRSSVLAASELAGLYHFPHSETAKTENVVRALSRSLPAPLTLKNGSKLDVVLGENSYHGATSPIGLTSEERERHVYIIGGTGNGKTTMLQNAIVQDMKSGKGLAVVDPHGDMAEAILRHVPKDRLKDVVYFNPDDLLYPMGLNLLELAPGLSGAELMREKDLITESVISVFRKIFSDDDSGGHRVEYVLRNTIQTALTLEDATLFTIFSLLNDPKFRKKVTGKLENPDLKNFWKNELGKAGEFQRVKMAAGITAKIGRFLFSASAKQILEQPKSTIDFDNILSSGKILICNLSKGLLGEDTSELFGITILAKLQLASLRRARIQQADRRPFYLYVDEFQNFATASFVQMLSEARKYKLFMLMAEQSTSQQEDQQMVSIILANVGTVVCFRTGNPQDERLLLPLFSPFINVGEIANLPSFNFYARLSALNSQEPLSGHTVLLADDGSQNIAEDVINLSRSQYAIRVSEQLHQEQITGKDIASSSNIIVGSMVGD